MRSIETIYSETIKPLPADDQIRLAEMIRKNLDSPRNSPKRKRSALDVLNSIRAEGVFKTSAEVDEYVRRERDSWDD